MQNYKFLNNLIGWLVFLIAAFVYLSTIEPTASFWDCGEFIATAHKLQVGHPPGAPFFLLLGRMFILFAGSDLEQVPVMVNAMSALASAFTILFLFWTTTAIAKKIVSGRTNPEGTQIGAIIGAGSVAALAYTFTDSFWFSAVEGEVYATSSFFTAFVFWAIFKWENVADERHASRWLILIAYMMGLSIGVHLLNLLAIPALAFVYYFRKETVTRTGILKTALISLGILVAIQYGIIPGIIYLATRFELLFVNTLGLPFHSGLIVYSLLIIGGVTYGLIRTQKNKEYVLNTILLCFTFILLGYSSFAQIVIRSNANTPMDENNPENVFTFLSYLNREQYGDRPLFKGQYYNARVIKYDEGSMAYIKGKDKYVPTSRKIIPVYDASATTILPRMYSSQENHVRAYKEWTGIKGEETPSFAQNLQFLFKYQIGHMYWRYFMWNFAGRQNDLQGHGEMLKGNWLSGIDFIDAMRLGSQDTLSESVKSNKARNKFYLLPFLLGLWGMFYHFRKDKKDAAIVLMLFFFTGIAIVLYLNGPPFQPRERDYAYVGSFYAFAIWIGIGVLGLIEFLKKKMPETVSLFLAITICLAAVPGIMAKEGWDDHDRSGRYTSRDFAKNYLNSVAPNAILFTNGDNDTFPLWYAQEVEGIRTDVRVVNLSLLNTDWYIDQMKRKAYESEPLPFTLEQEQYVSGTRDYIPFYDRNIKAPVDIREVVQFIKSDRPEAMVAMQGGKKLNYYPTKNFRLPIDKDAILKNGVVHPDQADKIVDELNWTISRNYLTKADIMILDLIAHFNWSRPIYFAVTVNTESFLNLHKYFRVEGLANRLVPVIDEQPNENQPGFVDSKIMYDNMMNKFVWGNMASPNIYMDQNNQNMTSNFRNNFARLAETLLNEGKNDSAVAVLDRCVEVMPDKTVPFNIFMLRIAELYITSDGVEIDPMTGIQTLVAGSKKTGMAKAIKIINRIADIYENDARYYFSLKGSSFMKSVDREANQSMAVMQELVRMARITEDKELIGNLEGRFNQLANEYGSLRPPGR